MEIITRVVHHAVILHVDHLAVLHVARLITRHQFLAAVAQATQLPLTVLAATVAAQVVATHAEHHHVVVNHVAHVVVVHHVVVLHTDADLAVVHHAVTLHAVRLAATLRADHLAAIRVDILHAVQAADVNQRAASHVAVYSVAAAGNTEFSKFKK